jgi:hypothetical protein
VAFSYLFALRCQGSALKLSFDQEQQHHFGDLRAVKSQTFKRLHCEQND